MARVIDASQLLHMLVTLHQAEQHRSKASPAEGGEDEAAQLLHGPLGKGGLRGVQQAGEGVEEAGQEGAPLVGVHQLHALKHLVQQLQPPLHACTHAGVRMVIMRKVMVMMVVYGDIGRVTEKASLA